MTPEQRQAARARCEAATAGPWRTVKPCHGFRTKYKCVVLGQDSLYSTLELQKADADFIANARIDLPAALDALEAAEAEITRLRAVILELREQVIVGDLAALELTNGFAWTKQREKQYRDYADAVTRKLTGESESCES